MRLRADSINFVAFVVLFLLSSCSTHHPKATKPLPPDEVIYHVVQRSFYDSNGDHIGDLKGLTEKLDYLQGLGVTSILMLPLYSSVYYHNYFSDDFQKIDPEFGTTEDYINLVKNVHARGMKIYMDMETQYVTEDHLWYKDALQNPSSPYTDYLVFNGPGNTQPESIVWNLTTLTGYDGAVRKITTVNMNSKKVLEYNYGLFKYFMDPDNNGNFDDGVDGFRLDHMMDVLDGKEKFSGLFKNFWSPLLKRLRQINPKLIITAEQANWGSYGFEYFEKGEVDRVFAFKLLLAIASFDKTRIASAADSTFNLTPKKNQQVVFIENHDVQRFATTVKSDPGKLRVAASLNLLLGGVPAIYYGQELGMTGAGGFGKFGNSDANDIPQREAFEWYKEIDGKGMALWYRNTGAWWDQTNLKAGDGISLEEEQSDENSLFNYYKKLIALRKGRAAFITGTYLNLINDNKKTVSFLRHDNGQELVVIVNLSDAPQDVALTIPESKDHRTGRLKLVFGSAMVSPPADKFKVTLDGYSTQVWEINR